MKSKPFRIPHYENFPKIPLIPHEVYIYKLYIDIAS